MSVTSRTATSVWPSAWPPAASPPVPSLSAFLDEIQKRDLHGVTVTQTGCIGVCRLEPVVEVFAPGEEKVTYVKVDPEMVPTIVEQHLMKHQVVTGFTIGAAE